MYIYIYSIHLYVEGNNQYTDLVEFSIPNAAKQKILKKIMKNLPDNHKLELCASL